MNTQEWLEDSKTIQKSKKSYAHFDNRTDIKKVSNYITDPDKVEHHGFYPFIHYVQKNVKYNKEKGKKVKERDICYAAHIDRCIYQYYSFKLNEFYNERIKLDGIEEVPVAYRTDLHVSNIQSANRAFSFIRDVKECYVMIGDFTGFFDNLDHQYLKKQICYLMGVEKLPADFYAVFKNITKYSRWELTDLLCINGLSDTESGRKSLNKRKTVLSKQQYRENRTQIVKNEFSYGIPQGSPISAILANIYMLEADRLINNVAKKYSGLYMRYSDDFIIVIPGNNVNVNLVFEQIKKILSNIPKLQLENSKTQIFKAEIPKIENVGREYFEDADVSKKIINFLGFAFNGEKISLRAKTLGKYYYRMNRKAKSIAKNKEFQGSDNLYMRYSERGANGKRGNFFTYVNNAEKEFGEKERIRYSLENNMAKIRKALNRNKG